MMDKLLPCPFCGGVPILELFNDGFFDYARIRCCRVMFDWCGDETGEQAIAAWNRRAQPDNEPLTLDELKQMDGEPVWTITKGVSSGHWEIIKTVNDKFIYLCDTMEGIYDLTIATYGKTWLAYRHKPERSEG